MKGSRIGAGILISLLDLGIEGCGNDMIFNASSGNSLNLMDDNHITTREECVANNGDGCSSACLMEKACQDSDNGDSGEALLIYGQVTGKDYYGVYRNYYDSCSSSGGILEYYCSADNTIKRNSLICSDGYICNNGACVVVSQSPDNHSSVLDNIIKDLKELFG